MDFGAALPALKAGKSITRSGWLQKGILVCVVPGLALKVGEAGLGPHAAGADARTMPYIAMSIGGALTPWQSTLIDIFADDWVIVDMGSPAAEEKPLPPELTDTLKPPKERTRLKKARREAAASDPETINDGW